MSSGPGNVGSDPRASTVQSHAGRRRWAIVIVIALALLFAFGIVFLNLPSRKIGPIITPVPVELWTVQLGDFAVEFPAVGLVQALNTVQVHTRIDGMVDQIYYKEGETVAQGVLLLKIDDRPYQAALTQAQEKYQQDQATLYNRQLDLDRYQKLASASFATDQQLKTQQALVNVSKALVAADQAAIQNAQTQLSYTQIHAPISGRIGFRQLDAGNIVHAGDQMPLLTIVQTDPINVVFSLPENELFPVSSAMQKGQLKVTVFSSDGSTLLATGVLSVINNQVDVTSGSVQLKASFQNRDARLWPGQSVNVRLHIRNLENVMLVPLSAVQHNQNGAYVWLVDDANRATIRQVQIGNQNESQSVVLSGLTPGQHVVQNGQYRLAQGDIVSNVAPPEEGKTKP